MLISQRKTKASGVQFSSAQIVAATALLAAGAAGMALLFRRSLALKSALIALVLLLPALPAFAGEIDVDSTCTLAQAINEANGATSGVGSCEAGTDGAGATGLDTINMPATAGTLRLSARLPTITSVIVINGNGWTISGDSDDDGDGDTGIFLLNAGKLTISDMTLTKANVSPSDENGGAIRLFPGALVLNNVVLSDNKAVGQGGAVFIGGQGSSASISNSVFSNNATTNAADGGAIYNHVSLSVKSSAFNGNSADGTGWGGAISTSSEAVSTTIVNSTFYGNSAFRGGAIHNNGSGFKLLHATVVNNTARSSNPDPVNQGGGVYNTASGAEIKNSLLSGNTGFDCRQSVAVTGINTNLIRTGNCGTPYSSADPSLPAAPTTPSSAGDPPAYFALPSNSPAVNAVDCLTDVTVDQVGTSRPQPANGKCDIGAYEYPVPAAPDASFSAVVDANNILRWNFDASGSSGQITSYAWTFGDGSSGTGRTTSRTYSGGGSYTVTLTVTGPGGSDTATRTISVSWPPPTASFSAVVDASNVLRWNFDAGGSSGRITSYAWDFGDSSSGAGRTTSRTYSGGGSYTVTLTVTGPGGSDTATRTISVSWPPPRASFSASVDAGNVLRWNFDASGSSGRITTYAWTFGDGASGTGGTTAHTYSSGGSYTVTLTVTGPGGSDRATQSISVSTPPVAPRASFTFSVSGYQVRFTSTSTGSNLSFSWDVDGDSAEDYSDQNPRHTYPSRSATYTVTLTVSNSAGSDSASQRVSVSAPPARPTAVGPTARPPRVRDEPTATSTAAQVPTPIWTPIPSPSPSPTPPTHTYVVNELIFLQSANGDISFEGLAMLELDKHPSLQGGRLAARVWRSNRQCAHRVASGENLFRLAMRYQTTVATLKNHNYLPSDLIAAGQELALPICPRHMMELRNTRVCFKAVGELVLIDTAASPPAVYSLPSYAQDGFTCAAITRPGTIVLTDRR